MTKGLVFGCHPHRGPAFSLFLQSFIRLNYTDYPDDSETRILAVLEINSDFQSHVTNKSVLSFWETQGVRVFTRELSQCSGISAEPNGCEDRTGERKSGTVDGNSQSLGIWFETKSELQIVCVGSEEVIGRYHFPATASPTSVCSGTGRRSAKKPTTRSEKGFVGSAASHSAETPSWAFTSLILKPRAAIVHSNCLTKGYSSLRPHVHEPAEV
jgi:hypothetical protein